MQAAQRWLKRMPSLASLVDRVEIEQRRETSRKMVVVNGTLYKYADNYEEAEKIAREVCTILADHHRLLAMA